MARFRSPLNPDPTGRIPLRRRSKTEAGRRNAAPSTKMALFSATLSEPLDTRHSILKSKLSRNHLRREAVSRFAPHATSTSLLIQLVPELVETLAHLPSRLAEASLHLAAEALIGALVLHVEVAAGAADILFYRSGCFVKFSANFVFVGSSHLFFSSR